MEILHYPLKGALLWTFTCRETNLFWYDRCLDHMYTPLTQVLVYNSFLLSLTLSESLDEVTPIRILWNVNFGDAEDMIRTRSYLACEYSIMFMVSRTSI
jgi:hypothetical protein